MNHIAENAWYNFILNYEITQGTKFAVKTKMLTIASVSHIYLGFCSRNLFGVGSYSHAEIVLYRADGYLFEGGSSKQTGVASQKGDTIESEIDLIENKVSFKKNGTQIATSNLP